MRIGVDATSWANGRGYGRFIRQVLPVMAARAPDDQFACFLDERSSATFDVAGPNVRPIEVPLGRAPTLAAAADDYRAPTDMLRLTRAVRRESLDVFFSPTVYTYFPLPLGLPAVVTVHDAIAERFPELTLPTRRARLFWRAKVWLALKQSRLVLTVSDFAKRELVEMLGVDPTRIRVAVEAPAPVFRPSSAAEVAAAAAGIGLPAGAPYFIYVGGFNPHKNLPLAVQAHAAIAGGRPDDPPHLVLVGAVSGDVFHGDQARIREAIAAAGTEGLVHWPGFVPDPELRHLYSGALAVLLPSACEGFGLPAIEAAACGTPAVATTVSPLPELLEGAGRFVEPGDANALEQAMGSLADDPALRRRLGEAALERTRPLTWERAAGVALDAIREAAA